MSKTLCVKCADISGAVIGNTIGFGVGTIASGLIIEQLSKVGVIQSSSYTALAIWGLVAGAGAWQGMNAGSKAAVTIAEATNKVLVRSVHQGQNLIYGQNAMETHRAKIRKPHRLAPS